MKSNTVNNRRRFLKGLGALLAHSACGSHLYAGTSAGQNNEVEYGRETLGVGIRSRYVDNNNGVNMHFLEAGFDDGKRPCVVLLHGFPELAYTWRNQLLPLAAAGFHVVAPDLRGHGKSALNPVRFSDDLLPYELLNRVADVLGLVRALGYERVDAVIGHDWGSPTAAWCALVRPDVFRSVVLMSTPFDGPSTLPLDTAKRQVPHSVEVNILKELAALPHPRKHYWWAYAARGANEDMWHAPQGVHDLLRAMYYYKSADWPGNKPFALKSWAAVELAKMPTYYIMNLDEGIATTMATHMPSAEQIATCHWITEKDMQVYSAEYTRTGFQGGLNGVPRLNRLSSSDELGAFSGRTIDVPALFIGGASEWGPRQSPGVLEGMQNGACTRLLGVHFVDGAGHSIPEEQPEQVNRLLIEFLHRTPPASARGSVQRVQ